MLVLAHRGLWSTLHDENSIEALTDALDCNYGIEFDVRDSNGSIVIAHDIVNELKPSALQLFDAYYLSSCSAILAINIKADGLGRLIADMLAQRGIKNYFCFDMSVPETLRYRRSGIRYFTRQSEYEENPVFYHDAAGVWMDMFESDWITADDIRLHLDRGKQVAIVSPELHVRPHMIFWEGLKDSGLYRHDGLMLCTDHPVSARSFFDA
jgi:hypothetical protein